ncbi:MAG: PAS domain S-box protein [Synergistaceae bacterium]|nr:PAS domain S-box protein [Synergistaceae bacterium]
MFKKTVGSTRLNNSAFNKYFLAASLIFFIFAANNVYSTWKEYMSRELSYAVILAESTGAFISQDQISSLYHTNDIEHNDRYIFLKKSLQNLEDSVPQVSSAYLLSKIDGKVHYLVDSANREKINDSANSAFFPDEKEDHILQFFEGGAPSPNGSVHNDGEITSVYAPVLINTNGDATAVIGIDYYTKALRAEAMKRALNSTMTVLALFILLLAGYMIIIKNVCIQSIGEKLQESEYLLKNVFQRIPVGIAAGNRFGNFSEINPTFEKIIGWSKEQLKGCDWKKITHPDDLPQNIEKYEKFIKREVSEYSIEKRVMRYDGSYSWISFEVAALDESGEDDRLHMWIIQDINERKIAKEALEESERSKSVLLANLPGMAYRCLYDRKWTLLFVSEGCYELTGYRPEDLVNSKERSFNDLIKEEYKETLWLEWGRILAQHSTFRSEYFITTASGESKWVLETGQGVYRSDGSVEAIEGIIIDISNLKKKEEEIQYINDHDHLTDLYNRQYFEKKLSGMNKKENLPLSILVADINGLHLINEAFGQHEGDLVITKSARIIQGCCREKDITARIGGDEFGIIMPQTGNTEAHELLDMIKEACVRYNENNRSRSPEINISMGYSTIEEELELVEDAMKTANEYMRNRKLFSQQSSYSDIISSIMTTVYEKSQETEKHAERLAELSTKTGRMLNLMEKDLGELQLLGMLHDIGKIGIDDKILNKPGKLTEEEWVIMKRHPEIGYRIAKASHKLSRIADYILSHHERWDGAGYPKGLKGEDIPLLSRILAVADAYDAMTEDRVYRKAMSKKQAIEEIKKNSGSQFDPLIAKIFIESVLMEEDCLPPGK